ncbi:glycosyltransferase family 4 protein [Sulfurihydrogenibium subterraneum]|uniref:glycosyltransferase family 4 protein n=1 Tax=Sulfurihydrogenibium subterraneum TaxID=171121 RepID=UPI00048C25C3|nr:glycosyltransferase [Sulfurihydrogenibium subterraneum]
MLIHTITFAISFFVCFLIILYSKKLDIFITDHLHAGPQRFHENPTPRIGGFGIFIALSVGLMIYNPHFWIYVIVSLPIFLSGFVEDLTRTLHPKIRLFLMSIGGIIAYFVLDVKITKVDVPLIDQLLSVGIISLLFTVFALVGLSNAINIIDGFNGLASGVSIMILLAIGYVANDVGDFLIRDFSIMSVFALLGFFILNFPFGKIFLGDGGAYFIGFWIGGLVILLVKNNPSVSPWFALAVNFYPVYEVLFSFYRKEIIRGTSAFEPDPLHYHMMVYRVISLKKVPFNNKTLQNSATSVFLWVLNLFAVLPSVIFYNNTLYLIIVCLFFAIIYNLTYRKLIHSKAKAFLK